MGKDETLASTHVNIRPGMSVLAVLAHLNYRVWYAVAEFVDNAIQSWASASDEIRKIDGSSAPLIVILELDVTRRVLRVRDNAGGIPESDMARAFRTAEPPRDRSGLSEFGMGMKSAACWLSPDWSVRTKALGERVEKTVRFDVNEILRTRRESLDVQTESSQPEFHYTEIELRNLRQSLTGRTLGKLRTHLASLYRDFLRHGDLKLILRKDGEDDALTYEDPVVLEAAEYLAPDGAPVLWKKDVSIELGEGRRVRGFAALRARADSSDAGFSLFRRRRVIEGSGDDKYRPEAIFRRPNSFTWQRLFGEFHLEGFDVSHTKDGFQWAGFEDRFLETLRSQLDAPPLRLLAQAEGFRVRRALQDSDAAQIADRAVAGTAKELEGGATPLVAEQIANLPLDLPPAPDLKPAEKVYARTARLDLRGMPWEVTVEVVDDPSIRDWVQVSDQEFRPDSTAGHTRRIHLRLAASHPFTQRFRQADGSGLECMVRLAVAVSLGTTAARHAGVKFTDCILSNMNSLLRDALAADMNDGQL